ncbi:MAG: DUF502 domain-containing protein [Phycisphaerae bacterium]|nr:DUF502 domain-containing protein [Phycisphaerae bacterium]
MEAQTQKKGFWGDFKHFFLRGLAAVLPSLLSLVLIIKGYQFINQYVGVYVNWAIIRLVAHARLWIFGGAVDEHIANLEQIWDNWHLHIGGFIIAISLIYFLGIFLASFVGRWIWRLVEAFLNRTPVVGQVYPHIKQVTDFFLSEKRLQYSQVVALEYPRKGIWSLGLLTGEAPKNVRERLGDDIISVFMPSSPTPLTGYVICTKRSEVVELTISIDEAFRFIISGGVLKPSRFVDTKTSPAGQLPGAEAHSQEKPAAGADEQKPNGQT